MTKRVLDGHGRWRSKTIAFHVSPEEDASIDLHAKLSGLTKQEYLIRRCQQQDIIVRGNIKVYKNLKDQLEDVLTELKRLDNASEVNDLLTETIRVVAATIQGMNKENQ